MINLSYTNPYDYLSRPFSRLIAEAEEGEDKGEGMINRYTQGFMYAVGEIGKPYGTPSMSTQLLTDIVKGETETGRKLYAANDILVTEQLKDLFTLFKVWLRQFYLLI